MRKFRLLSFPILIILVLLLSACSGVPTDSIKRTDQAKAEAIAERADLFAQDYWTAAEDALRDANAKIDAKSYGEAGTLLLKAKTNYNKARDLAKSKREDLIKRVNGVQTTTNLQMKSRLTENPEAAKLTPARKKEFDAEVKQIENSILKVSEQLKNGQYAEADYLAQTTLRKVFEIQQEFLKK